jgi:predicted peptidase
MLIRRRCRRSRITTCSSKLRSKVLAALLLLTTSCATDSHFLERTVSVNEHQYRYRVWLPPNYTKLHHWPVILFLHGSGERGDDNLRQLSAGIGPALEKYDQRYKAVVVLPQCRMGEEWYGEEEIQAMAALEESIREFHGDRRRVYLTGVSMGGAGAWYMARHRRKFAAVMPVSAEVARQADDPFPSDPPPDIARIVGARDPYAAMADAIGKTPVWIFHGAEDDVIPVTEARSMFAAINKAGGNASYTEYAGGAHNVWDTVYANRQVVQWLFKQTLK